MTQEERAALREAASNVLNSWGQHFECVAYRQAMQEVHPAAVLALLDECERMAAELREYRGLKRMADKAIAALEDGA